MGICKLESVANGWEMVAVRKIFDSMTFLIYCYAFIALQSIFYRSDDNAQETMQHSVYLLACSHTHTQTHTKIIFCWYQIFYTLFVMSSILTTKRVIEWNYNCYWYWYIVNSSHLSDWFSSGLGSILSIDFFIGLRQDPGCIRNEINRLCSGTLCSYAMKFLLKSTSLPWYQRFLSLSYFSYRFPSFDAWN